MPTSRFDSHTALNALNTPPTGETRAPAAGATAVHIPALGNPTPARTIRVLLVDDYPLLRAGLRAVLEQTPDMEVVGEAATGEEALLVAELCHPDVVIMDLDMPGAGGLAATRTLTAPETHPKVLVLTTDPDDERVVDALRAGAGGYITKDVSQSELVSALRVAATGDVYVRPHVGPMLAANLHHKARPREEDETRARFEKLSEREQAVLRLIAEGHTGPEIGRTLGITAKTVDTYRHRIQQKIGLARRTDYIRFALTIGLLRK